MASRVTISGVYILEGMKNRFSSSGGDNLGSRKMGEVVLNNQNMLVVRCGAEKVNVDIYPWIIGCGLRGNWFLGCFSGVQLACKGMH